ncbi:MAG: LacI family transcriptional regulator [Propionibacteriaceae bacterium]|jgi:DNA-binding LacI/PurR family transcriptional regulator|nr:LacI family transcriptional regulator [Propionibacteriaceae bacterium]
MATRIEDVARAAGVSTATVSRALRGLPHVTEDTRQAVTRMAAALDYVPSRSASALASGQTRAIGLVAPAISRWFFANACEGAEHTLRANGFDALLYSVPDDPAPRQRFDADGLRGRADAVLVASMSLAAGEVERLRALALPVVFVSVEQPGFAFVGIDDQAAAVTATRHLIDLGHRVIGHIGGLRTDRQAFSPTRRRRQGWAETVAAAGLASDGLDVEGDFSAASGHRCALALLDRQPEVTAIFAASDEMAMGAVKAVRERGLSVGEDVSIVGLDGHNLADVMGLTTVAQPAYDQGAKAAAWLLQALEGRDVPAKVVFDTELIRRSSTGAPRRSRRP